MHCFLFNGWMDGFPAIQTDAGTAVIKTPATKATTVVKSGAFDASGNHIFYF